MSWDDATARVCVEACAAHPDDVVLVLGEGGIAGALAGRARRVVQGASLADAPAGVSIVVAHAFLRHLAPPAQRAFLAELGRVLPSRGLAVIGDLMWSFPPDQIDEPELFGQPIAHVQTTATYERWARDAGFLPDVHRFAPGVAVMILVKT
ncbi:MAG: hypothetical protein ACOZNI_12875 [Myxococcota bacterium]